MKCRMMTGWGCFWYLAAFYLGCFVLVLGKEPVKEDLDVPKDVPKDAPSGDSKVEASTEAVITVTMENFESFVNDNEVALLEFYAPWCGHCKKLAPEYEKAAKSLLSSGSAVRLGKVDATKDTALATQFSVGGYPTLKLFRRGKAEDYKGGRTAGEIVTWIESVTGPPVMIVTKLDEVTVIASKYAVTYVGSFTSMEIDQYKTFQSVAEENRQLAYFVAYVEATANNEVSVYRKIEGTTPVGSHKVGDKETLLQWCKEERFTLFGSIDGENYSDHLESGRDLVWFASEKDDYEAVSPSMKEAAREFRSRNNFVWLNTEQFKDHAQSALGVKDFPALVVQKSGGRYIYPHNLFDFNKVVNFVKDVYAGKVEKYLMSDEIPEQNDDVVKVVVGKSFKDLVLQSDKFVLLEVYAPWCGHCKKFEPIYKEFAQSMAKNKNLLVAKMDGTTNEAPVPNFEWKGFPTIFFVKAGSNEPEIYEGDRTKEGLTEFISSRLPSAPGVEGEEGVKTEL